MDLLWEAVREAIRLLTTGDDDVYGITLRTIAVTGISTLVAMLAGLPIGFALALTNFPGRHAFVTLANAGTGAPPVVAGLVVAILLWRSGPVGGLGLIYTPAAIVIAQAVIATPIIAAVSAAALMALPPSVRAQIRAMGANDAQYLWLLAREARLSLLIAIIAGFGAVISEVGASIMVGGNIAGETRLLTTAAVVEVSRGNFGTALAFGFILLGLIVVVSVALTTVQQRARRT
ncbi:MAG: ABC transporter permease [Dehalococcoidia bacterium]